MILLKDLSILKRHCLFFLPRSIKGGQKGIINCIDVMSKIRNNLIFVYLLVQLLRKYSISLGDRIRVLFDYVSLFRAKRLTTDEYFDFEFEKRDSLFKQSFLGHCEQWFYLDYLNPIKYYSLARNKYLTHKMLDIIGVRKSQLFCYYQPEARFLMNDDCAHDIFGVLRILQSKQVKECVIKTTESSHGDNVWVINTIDYKEDDALLTKHNGSIVKLSSVLGRTALIFESVVHQTEQFASFNKSSVNTVRFMTTLWPDGTARVIATWLKVGREGKCVDNAGNGGNVDAAINKEDGTIYNVVQFDGWRRVKEIDCHPDSESRINGVIINDWSSIVEEVKLYQQAFPYCKAAGWDIAITDEGPVVIEVNDFWDRTGQYFIRRGWRNEIRDCYLAWRDYWGDAFANSIVSKCRKPMMDKTLYSKFS